MLFRNNLYNLDLYEYEENKLNLHLHHHQPVNNYKTENTKKLFSLPQPMSAVKAKTFKNVFFKKNLTYSFLCYNAGKKLLNLPSFLDGRHSSQG